MSELSRRDFVLGGLALAAAGALPGSGCRPSQPARQAFEVPRGAPNVLLIVTDQERARHHLPSQLALPQRDRLMERATVFRNAHAATNLCSMSRGNIYTGRHAQQNGVWENVPLPFASDLREDVPTLGHLFQDAGYDTSYFGKWHLTQLAHGSQPGRAAMAKLFRSYGFAESDQATELDGVHVGWREDPNTVAAAMRFFDRRRDGDRPWFSAVNLVNPHDIMFFMTGEHQRRTRIMNFPDPILRAPDDPLYAEDLDIALPENFGPGTLEGKPAAQREYQKVMELALGEIPWDREDLWRSYQNYYFNCLRDSDRHLGQLLDALETTGQADRTVVVFAADHGEMAGVHGLREKSGVMYREVSNVPLWIRHPDVEGGRETSALASLVDIAPTLLSLAGVSETKLREVHPGLVGTDLGRALGRSADDSLASAGRDAVLLQWTSLVHLSSEAARNFVALREAEHLRDRLRGLRWPDFGPHRGHMRGLFDGRFKFARYFSPVEHHRPETFEELVARNDLELYDTIADPGETRNLAFVPEHARARIESLNRHLLDLIDRELGADDGSYLPGPASWWRA